MLKNQHNHNPSIPSNKRPTWADAVGIPLDANEGSFHALYTPELAREILFGKDDSNRHNRPLKSVNLRPIVLALKDGAFNEANPDRITFDWNWALISGQKRLYSIYSAGSIPGGLHQNYKNGVRIHTAYGIDPVLRKQSDGVEERKSYHKIELHPSKRTNKAIHQAITFYTKELLGLSSHALSAEDYASVYASNKEGLDWACNIPVSGRSKSAPVAWGLAEMYKLNSQKAILFAEDLFDIGTQTVPQARTYKRWRDKATGKAQRHPYLRLVCAMQALLMNKAVARLEPASWGKDELRTIGTPRLEKPLVREERDAAAKAVTKLGLKYANTVVGAVKLITQQFSAPSGYISDFVERNITRWEQVTALIPDWRRALGCYPWSAVAAFLFMNDSDPRTEDLALNPAIMKKLSARTDELRNRMSSLTSQYGRTACLESIYIATGFKQPCLGSASATKPVSTLAKDKDHVKTLAATTPRRTFQSRMVAHRSSIRPYAE